MKYKYPFVCCCLTTTLLGFAAEENIPERTRLNDLQPALSSPAMTFNEAPSSSVSPKNEKIAPTIEFKAGYFFFSSSKMQDIYNKGGLDLQISGSYPLWKWLQVYGSVEYLQRHGHSLNGDQRTRFWAIPLSLGLKPVFTLCDWLQYYFTLGPRYFFVHTHQESPFVKNNMNRSGLGGFVNTGFNFFPCKHLFIDLFGEYSYKRMSFHPSCPGVYGSTRQIGGFTFGLGLGYAF